MYAREQLTHQQDVWPLHNQLKSTAGTTFLVVITSSSKVNPSIVSNMFNHIQNRSEVSTLSFKRSTKTSVILMRVDLIH